MGTVCGAGASADADTETAITSALGRASEQLGERTADLGFVFVSPRHDLSQAMAVARRRSPATDFLACTTAGEISAQGLVRGGVSSLLVAWDGAEHVASPLLDLDEADPDRTAALLCDGFEDRARSAKRQGLAFATTVLFGDGLSAKLEKLVAAVRRSTSPFQQVVGGGAADDDALSATWVGNAGSSAKGSVIAAHVFSRAPWGVGVEHGLSPASPRMLVTSSEGNVVREIDHKPAVDVYRERAIAEGLPAESATSPEFLIQNELGLYFFEDIVRVRAPLATGADGTLSFSGEVPEGSAVCFVNGAPAAMIAAARRAAKTAASSLGDAKPAGVLVVSCTCRGALLGERYDEEIAAIAAELPGVPIAGFLSYGEIARTQGKLDGYHNNTLVVVVIPE